MPHVVVVEQNPNEPCGSNATVCSPTGQDCPGPYVIFPAQPLNKNNVRAPHTVMCSACPHACREKLLEYEADAESSRAFNAER